MSENVTVLGMVISTMDIGEYDKRLVILTKEEGKISAFARGARKPNSPFLAGSQPMAFGEFTLYRGRNSFSVSSMKISDYFSNSMTDIDSMYMGMYLLEFADYFGKDGLEAGDMLKLLYFSMKVLAKAEIPARLIRRVYELKMLELNGLFPELFSCVKCGSKENLDYFDVQHNGMVCENCHGKVSEKYQVDQSTLYALQYIVTSDINKLFSFNVTEEVFEKLDGIIESYVNQHVDKKFNSLELVTE